MIHQLNIYGRDMVEEAIERLRGMQDMFPKIKEEGYYLAFSGGKDSVVIKKLADMAGIKYDAHYRVTSIDPPELVKFIKKEYPDVHFEVPHYPHDYKNEKLRGKQITMGNLIVEKGMPPTRIHRFCCAYLKESGGNGRITITGVRWAESNNRKKNAGIMTITGAGKKEKETLIKSGNFADTPKGRIVLVNDNTESREMIEYCYKQHKTTCNPIIDWTDSDVGSLYMNMTCRIASYMIKDLNAWGVLAVQCRRIKKSN